MTWNLQVNTPRGIAVDPKLNLIYVADELNSRIQILSEKGELTLLWQLSFTPFCIVISKDRIYISDGSSISTYGMDRLLISRFLVPYGAGGYNICIIEKKKDTFIGVCGYSCGKILVYKSDGELVRSWRTGYHPFGITYGFGKIYVGLTEDIEVYTFKGKLITTWCPNLNSPYSIIIENEELHIACCGNGNVGIFGPSTS